MAIKLKSLLLERHQEDLYHATFERELLDILSDNSIKLAFVGGTLADQQMNKGYPFFLSTMRSKYGNYARGNYENTAIQATVIIHLDGRALTAAGYKIFWVDYWGNGPKSSEEEERIASNKDEIKPLKNFIKDIHVYLKPEMTNPHLLERLHQIDDLTQNFPFPIYFYPPSEAQGFKAQRTEKAVRHIQNIVPQPKFTAADQEHKEWLKTHNDATYNGRHSKILRTFLDIYYDKKVDTSTYPGSNVMQWLMYCPHDAQSQIACEIHNLKSSHPPIFREFVEIMKDKGFKTVREFVEFVIRRETERNRERQKIEREKDLEMLASLRTENMDDETGYKVSADFAERRDSQLMDLACLLKKSHGQGKVPWSVIPASLLKRVWFQFGKYHRIEEKSLDKIAEQILNNIARLRASTEMMGHTQNDVRPELSDNGYEFTDEEWDDWMTNYFTNNDGSWLLSDYGLPKLEVLYGEIFNAKTPEEKLYAIDKALNVIHQRNDLAAMFVEGGSHTLSDIADQGGYTSDTEVRENNSNSRIKLKTLMPESTVAPLIVYHGTGQVFKKFDINQAAQGIIWFASDKEKILSGNSGACNIKYIITAEVTIKHPAGWDAYEKMGIGELRRDGYDGLILSDGTTGKFDCAVFSERQIKIKKIEPNPNCKSI